MDKEKPMARANRHYLPGHVWHLTHRCHKREFLFKFAKDRVRWVQWLYEAKKRYGHIILDYMVTSNHIHLLVYDQKKRGHPLSEKKSAPGSKQGRWYKSSHGTTAKNRMSWGLVSYNEPLMNRGRRSEEIFIDAKPLSSGNPDPGSEPF